MATGFRTVGYYVDWAIYGRNFKPQDLKADQFSHILFAFVKINRDTGEIQLADPWADTDIHWDESWDVPAGVTNVYGIFLQLFKLKKVHRNLKTMLSIGGWTYSQDGSFAAGASTPEKRDKFARSAVQMVKDFGLDGIDLDWEYPVDATEAANYVDLLRLCRQYLNEANPAFELSIAAPCGADKIQKLDIPGMDRYLDFWNLMAYDFAGSWSQAAGHASNIFGSTSNPASTEFSFDTALRMYSAVNPHKLVVGMPLYGRGFANTDGPGKPYQGTGQGNWETGVWDYKNLPLPGSQEYQDDQLIASYSYDPAQRLMISYDTPHIAELKAKYIMSRGLGGAMWWETSGDKVGAGSLVQTVIDTFPPKKRTTAAPAKKKVRVKLAQDLSLSTEEEQEVRLAFDYFTDPEELGKDIIQSKDLKKAFSALGFNLSPGEIKEIKETIDPDDEGFIVYELFLEVAAMKMKDRDGKDELDKAFSLFTGGDDEGPITLQHLQRVAKALNENVTDDTLRDMLREASSGDRNEVNK
ncbi:hypothetical protein H072_1476 [Dactylellina haptotyla CBS 200.50]|uniref:chitinase n=1 Tax=Dactylellina haptotyla (strain CBS 200.50) TaxID=1284197 RepID=S8ANY0_DACHA|nr:hypothetical protein H072_1476 [Dactylellina haptotyla CBS 200.50]